MQIKSRWETRWFRDAGEAAALLQSNERMSSSGGGSLSKPSSAAGPRAEKSRARFSFSLWASRLRESVDDATRVAGKRRLSGVRCWQNNIVRRTARMIFVFGNRVF